jgi:muramidase (phage lysozyme)
VKQTTALVLIACALAGAAWLLLAPGAQAAPAPDASAIDPLAAGDWTAPPDSGWAVDAPADDTPQLPSTFDSILNQAQSMFSTSTANAANRAAFLTMLSVSEGTAGKGDNGYNVMFGDRFFSSYADHPRSPIQFTDRAGRLRWSSAAGRYQFIAATWDALRAKLALPDFSPPSQDAACLELVRQLGALGAVDAGDLAGAVNKCKGTWASLPGAGADQHEQKFSTLVAAYTNAGGALA